MASHGRRKTSVGMMALRAALLLWLCSGLCICMDEVPHLPFEPQGDAQRVPAEEPAAGVEADGSPIGDDNGDDANLPQPEEEGAWGASVPLKDEAEAAPQGGEAGGDQSEAGGGDQSEAGGDQSEAGGDQSEAVGDQSEADGDQSEVGGDQSEADGDQSETGGDQSEAVGDQSEAVEDQSEAPQDEEGTPSTEEPSLETKAPSAEPTDQSPELGDFVIRRVRDDKICLRACFVAMLKVHYVGEDENNKAVNRTAEIPVPEKANVGGWCERGKDKQTVLLLNWDEGEYSLKITFQQQNATTKGDPNMWEASRIQFSFDTGDDAYFDSAINAGRCTVNTSPGSTFFVTPQGNSRVCEAEDDIPMLPSAANKTERVTLGISKLQLEPYGILNGTFSEGVDCGMDLIENPNTNVASIAVGATLACLILVVIIVYAVGRKMGAINDRTGYKSVE